MTPCAHLLPQHLAALLMVAHAVWMTFPATASTFTATVMRCDAPPQLDGVLDDACWEQTPVLSEFIGLKNGEPADDTAVRLARDAAWLYVAVDCLNPHMAHVEQTCVEPDGEVQNDDSVELFLDPGTEGELYYHYKLNAGNVRGEQKVSSVQGKDLGWNLPWRSATVRRDDGWSAEMAIPLYVLLQDAAPAKARFNITRTRVDPIFDEMGAKVDREKCWSTMVPLTRSFHEPQHFALLRGLDQGRIEAPFLPGLDAVSVAGYDRTETGRRVYPVNVTLRNFTATPGRVRVRVLDMPVSGESQRTAKAVSLQGREVSQVSLSVPVASMLERRVRVDLLDASGEELLEQRNIEDTSALKVMGAPVADRSYYTSETEAGIAYTFGLPPEALRNLALIASRDGVKLARSDDLHPQGVLAVPLKELPVGRHRVLVRLQNDAGESLAESPVQVVRKAPKPGFEVKVDRVNRVLLRNGKPFFPWGMVYGPWGRRDRMEHDLQAIADAGFNFVYYWCDSDPDAFMKAAARHDLAVGGWVKHLAQPLYKTRRAARTPENLASIEQGVRVWAEHPNFLAYQTVDEPNLLTGAAYDDALSDARVLYDMVNRLDGYRPVHILFARSVPDRGNPLDLCEIMGYDVYIFGGYPSFSSSLDWMSVETRELARLAEEHTRVPWMIASSGNLDLRRTPRPLKRGEQMAQAYLAVIHGAKGLLLFHYTSVFHRQNWQTFPILSRQLRALAPCLVAPDVPHTVTTSPVAFVPEKRQVPDVQAALRRFPGQQYVLLAANAREYPCTVTIRLPGPDTGSQVRRLFSEALPVAGNGGWKETLEPFAVRAYDLGSWKPASFPVNVEVAIEAHPDRIQPETRIKAADLRKGKRNVMPNPQLAAAYLPHWPKFFKPYRMAPVPGIGSPECVWWRLDPERPRFGRHALRLQRDDSECWGAFVGASPPVLAEPAPFVLSFYMRANRDDAHVSYVDRGLGFGNQRFTVSREWKRHHVSGMLQPPEYTGLREFLLIPGRPGDVVWFDGFQLEAGREPTEFTLE